jgi:hypothetical protein
MIKQVENPFILKCDYCGREVETRWRRATIELSMGTDIERSNRDFCSYECLYNYAKEKFAQIGRLDKKP